MSNWEDIIGSFPNILTPAFKNNLSKALYYTIVCYKDRLVEESEFDDINKTTYYVYETLQQALNPRKKDDPKYTYIGSKITVDKKTKEKKELNNVALPMKKFANITIEVKNALIFLLSKYIRECVNCYKEKRQIYNSTDLLKQISDYSTKKEGNPITPFIIATARTMDVEKLAEGNFGKCLHNIQEKIKIYFKTDDDKYPERQLTIIVDAFIKFMKIIAINMTNILFERRQAINGSFLFGILRQLNSQTQQYGCSLSNELFEILREYMGTNKLPKKNSSASKKDSTKKTSAKKKKLSDDEDYDDEDYEEEEEEEEEEEKPKKNKPASKNNKKASSASKNHDEFSDFDVEEELNKEEEKYSDDDDYDNNAPYDD